MSIRLSTRLLLIVLAAADLGGCPSLTQRGELPPSIDRAQELERSGDAAGAARVYEQLAAQNSGTDRTALLLHAARDYLTARRTEDAARALGVSPRMWRYYEAEAHLLPKTVRLAAAGLDALQRAA